MVPAENISSTERDTEPRTALHPKQNGESPKKTDIKTTTIIIPPSSAVSAHSTVATQDSNTNNNNSTVDVAKRQELPTSVVQFLKDMPAPVQPPKDSEINHSGADAEKWEKRRVWREERRREMESEVRRVQELLNNVSRDKSETVSSTLHTK